MSDILEEILNDEKEAKRLKLFRKLFPAIITLTIIVALGIAGYSWFLQAKTTHNQEIGDSFVQLISDESKNTKLFNEILKEIETNNKSKLSELASIKLASEQIKLTNVSDSMQLLSKIINNKDYSEITKSYARILYISLVLDIDNLNNELENKVREYLQYFTNDSQVFYATATLLKSLFYFKNNQLDLAKQYALETLKLPRASAIIKEQAKAIIAGISIKE
ncbi:MAG: tetratricopeptide repeat protein [Rickettsiaceae bacterium]|nr:tetratricopeptide repeat protein [Rickettsiaceae bacterium]MCP5377916.1 tetratricopeptide repeat protein [Rickettsiaceae bacterium]